MTVGRFDGSMAVTLNGWQNRQTRDRSAQLPDVPAAAEILPGFENLGWFGLMVPAGTPPAVIEKVYADTAKALADPDMKARLEALGMAGVGNRPADFAQAIAEESKMWGQVVRQRKLSTN